VPLVKEELEIKKEKVIKSHQKVNLKLRLFYTVKTVYHTLSPKLASCLLKEIWVGVMIQDLKNIIN